MNVTTGLELRLEQRPQVETAVIHSMQTKHSMWLTMKLLRTNPDLYWRILYTEVTKPPKYHSGRSKMPALIL